jgi:hypothetical protein
VRNKKKQIGNLKYLLPMVSRSNWIKYDKLQFLNLQRFYMNIFSKFYLIQGYSRVIIMSPTKLKM